MYRMYLITFFASTFQILRFIALILIIACCIKYLKSR
mgnify:CR=1 FL=1|jgi:hypothetical protein